MMIRPMHDVVAKHWLTRLRHWCILKLIGQDFVLVNARIFGKVVISSPCPGALMHQLALDERPCMCGAFVAVQYRHDIRNHNVEIACEESLQ